MQILKAEDAKRSGHFDSWTRGLTSAARVKGCAAAIVPNRLIHDILQVSLTKAHEVVANDQASRLVDRNINGCVCDQKTNANKCRAQENCNAQGCSNGKKILSFLQELSLNFVSITHTLSSGPIH